MSNDERELTTGLRRLAEDTVVPPIDPEQEQRLLAAFDAHYAPRLARSNARSPRLAYFFARSGRARAAAGLLGLAATLVWIVQARSTRTVPPPAPVAVQQRAPVAVASVEPQPAPIVETPRPKRARKAQPKPASRDPQAFVMWPGATDLPRFESGQLMRVDLPASVVRSLGLRPSQPLRDDGTVQTDVLVGQDGYARAVRLVR